jgi:hypothetical protein
MFLLESDNLLSFTCSVLDKDPVDPKVIDLLDPDPDLYYFGIED